MRSTVKLLAGVLVLSLPLLAAQGGAKNKPATKASPGALTVMFNDGRTQALELSQPAANIVRIEFSGMQGQAMVERGQGFDGTWQGDWGKLTFRVYGNRAFGEYSHDQGRVVGTISPDGKTLEGYWLEAPGYRPPEDGGRFLYQLSDDGNSIRGQWFYGEHDKARDWSSKRAKP